ncbi:hypothetical protein Hanom_Chr06g00519641 [Helianthus anomalus]
MLGCTQTKPREQFLSEFFCNVPFTLKLSEQHKVFILLIQVIRIMGLCISWPLSCHPGLGVNSCHFHIGPILGRIFCFIIWSSFVICIKNYDDIPVQPI